MLVLFTTLEIILQCFPKDGPGLLQPALQQLLSITLSGESGNLTVTSKSNSTRHPAKPVHAHNRPKYYHKQVLLRLHGAFHLMLLLIVAFWSHMEQCNGMLL